MAPFYGQDLSGRINNSGQHFSKGQKKINAYITTHYDKAALMTASKLGEAAGVSESTIVRYASALGYSGYPELQKAIAEMVRNRLTAVQRMEIAQNAQSPEAIATILRQDLQNLRALLDELNADAFNHAKLALLSARRIYIIGLRASAPLAAFLGYYLNYIFDNTLLINQGGSEVREQLARAGAEDVLIGISFPRYSNRTIDSMKFAKSLNVTTIAITDSPSSPMGETADICLTARSTMASFVDSLVAPLSLINALIVSLGMEKKEELSRYFAAPRG